MGATNEAFKGHKISFSKIEEIINMFLSESKNKSQNLNLFKEIGLLKEYSYIKSGKMYEEIINYSRNNKTVRSFKDTFTLKEIFVEWTKIFFDINEKDSSDKQQFEQKLEKLKNKDLSLAFFQNNIKKNIKDSLFNKLIMYGIPYNIRDFIWDVVLAEKNFNKYYNFEDEKKEYISNLNNINNNPQIEKDLNRTFMKESEQTKDHLQKLRSLLNVINRKNNGYCQGMNFIVGFLLKLTKFDEIKTYYIIKNILPDIKGLFEDGFPLLNKNINTFDKYFKQLYPTLYNHFRKNDVYDEIWVGKWIQTLFTLSLPFEEVCSIWDILIIKGFHYIIYISLSIISFVEEDLLKLDDSSDILAYLQAILNPKDITLISHVQIEQIYSHIIPLNKILYKASEIEKKIKEIYIIKNNQIERDKSSCMKKVNLVIKNDEKPNKHKMHDYDSICSKGSDHSVKNSFSSKSTCSSNSCNLNSISTLNIFNSLNNNDNLKNNLYSIKFGLYHNNEHYNSIQNKIKFNSTKDTNNYKLVDNLILLNHHHNNVNNILSSNNLKYVIDPRTKNLNYLIYYG
jgi:hypothetical protein